MRFDALGEIVALANLDLDAACRQMTEPQLGQRRALGRIGSARAAVPLLATIGSRAEVPPRIVATALLRIGVSAHPALVQAM